nr:methyl-accepting chemotaxis protein [Polaromonas glacialis]
MVGAIAAVEAVQDSAKRMGEIVELIDSMALQTNILALNAAVEAAPAKASPGGVLRWWPAKFARFLSALQSQSRKSGS